MSVITTLRSEWATYRAYSAMRAAGANTSRSLQSVRSGGNSNLTDRLLTGDPRAAWSIALWWKLSPAQVQNILRAGLLGDLYIQHELFSVMQDTWPRLRKNLHEIRSGVSGAKFNVLPWTDDDGEDPTPEAHERADLVRRALRGFNPAPDADENDFEDAIYDLTNAMPAGVSGNEILWDRSGGEWMPRAICYVHPKWIAYGDNGRLQLRVSGSSVSDFGARTRPFDPNKFIIGAYKTKSGPASSYGLLHPIAWWWSAMMFGRDWMFRNANLFGIPFRWAKYEPNSSPADIAQIESSLENMGSGGYAAFPNGMSLEFLDGVKATGGEANPANLMTAQADKLADLLILGQTLTSDQGERGSQALGSVHKGIRRERIEHLAGWSGKVMTQQLARAICTLNYGTADFCPRIAPDFTEPEDPKTMAERDQIILTSGVPLPANWFYERHNVPAPQPGDAVIAPKQATPPPQFAAPKNPADQDDPATAPDPATMAARQPATTAALKAKAAGDPIAEKLIASSQLEAAKQWLALRAGIMKRLEEILAADDPVAALKELQADLPAIFRHGLHDPAFDSLQQVIEEAIGTAVINGYTEGVIRRPVSDRSTVSGQPSSKEAAQ